MADHQCLEHGQDQHAAAERETAAATFGRAPIGRLHRNVPFLGAQRSFPLLFNLLVFLIETIILLSKIFRCLLIRVFLDVIAHLLGRARWYAGRVRATIIRPADAATLLILQQALLVVVHGISLADVQSGRSEFRFVLMASGISLHFDLLIIN